MNEMEKLNRISIINVKNKLNLQEFYTEADTIYVRCPFCNSNQGTMKLSSSKNSYICKACSERGYAIGLFARNNYISTSKAYKILISKKADMQYGKGKIYPVNTIKSDDELDEVYRAFLELLKLSILHKKKLLNLGFKVQNIEAHLFRTIPTRKQEKIFICKKLQELGYSLSGCPGFFQDKNFSWDFNSHSGFFIPVISNNKIVGLRIHLDKRYSTNTTDIWFSSNNKFNGTKAVNRIMTILPQKANLKLVGKDNSENLILASEMILAIKLAESFPENIIVGVPNIISNLDAKNLANSFSNKINLVVDYHTMRHSIEHLYSTISNYFEKDNIQISLSYKECEIPNNLIANSIVETYNRKIA